MQEFSEQLVEKYDYELPAKGEFRSGILLEVNDTGAFIDIGVKHDGFVPRQDLDRLNDEKLAELKPGRQVMTKVTRPIDQEGALTLSLAQVQSRQDWERAQAMMDNQEIWHGEVTGYNRGGLLVDFGQLQAFVPASQIWNRRRTSPASAAARKARLKQFVGNTMPLEFIEINQASNRLIASERVARKKLRKQRREELMAELKEGEIRTGVVRHLTDFGAFVDIGGADGLIHISEISRQKIGHPRDLLEVGQELEVYILGLDKKRNRINLSLKQLQPNPWAWVDMLYTNGQLVEGKVSNVVDFGAFVELDAGVDGLLHVSEIADPAPDHPKEFVQRGDELILKIIRIDAANQQIGLSLKQVTHKERQHWQRAKSQAE